MNTLKTIILPPTLPTRGTVIWLHGLGAEGHDFVDIVPALQLPDALAIRFVFPHAPVRPVSLNGGLAMPAWFDIYGLTEESKIDVAGIQASDAALQLLIQQEIDQGIPPERIVLAGFSQGGVLALYTGLTYPKRLGGIIGLSTFLPQSALELANPPKQNTPIFMAHGDYDPLVLPEWGRLSYDYLLTQGYDVAWHTYPITHTVSPSEIQDIAAWLIALCPHI